MKRNGFRVGVRVSHRRRPKWSGSVVGMNKRVPICRVRIDGVKRTEVVVKVSDLAILPNHK